MSITVRSWPGDRLVAGVYEPIELTTAPDGLLKGYSDLLKLSLCWDDGWPRFYDPATDTYLETWQEVWAAREAAEAQAAIEQADRLAERAARQAAENRAAAEQAARESAETQAATEQAARLAAESRIRQLEAELRPSASGPLARCRENRAMRRGYRWLPTAASRAGPASWSRTRPLVQSCGTPAPVDP